MADFTIKCSDAYLYISILVAVSEEERVVGRVAREYVEMCERERRESAERLMCDLLYFACFYVFVI